MARTFFEIRYTDFSTAVSTARNILMRHGYVEETKNGETIWRKGVGFWTAKKFIKLEFFNNGILRLSGWVQPVFLDEMALQGFAASVPKRSALKVLQEIQACVR